MKPERPILYNELMIKAFFRGEKTNTRRMIKPQPDPESDGPQFMANAPSLNWEEYNKEWKPWHWDTAEGERITAHCKYGERGDILYAKETFYANGFWRETNERGKNGQLKKEFEDITLERGYNYHFIDNPPMEVQSNPTKTPGKLGWYKRPSLFMPKSIARIWQEIKGIDAQRIQDISETDAIAEGIIRPRGGVWYDYRDGCWYACVGTTDDTPAKETFRTLWFKINGEESWKQNPWVWRISLNTLSTTGKPKNLNP